MTTRHLLPVVLRAALVAAACAAAMPEPPAPPAKDAPARGAAAAAEFEWPGTYEIVGHGFPEGDRHATMTITRQDTTYALSLYGPPGQLRSLRIAGDSAHVAWDFGDASVMLVQLRGEGDELRGRWILEELTGAIEGLRQR
jgi:hypothetical protein